MRAPFKAPIRPPAAMPVRTAAQISIPPWRASAVRTPQRDTMEPADRSITPDAMTKVMPTARIKPESDITFSDT